MSVVPSFFARVSTRSLATMSSRSSAFFVACDLTFSGSPLTTAYSNFGFTAAYMFDGKVHGVVVQTASARVGLSASGNATNTDGSSTSL